MTGRIAAVAAACAALLLAVGCGGSSSHMNTTTTPTPTPTSGANVQAITVNSGPDGNYANGAFTSVTVCTPGTSNCQTIDGVLLDTGSSGLRILSSVLTVPLTQQKATDGNPVVECLPFVNGHTWGPVETADIQISGEKASGVPVQVLSDTDFTVPSACASHGGSMDTLMALGANGLLGVGPFAQDCGGACGLSPGTSNPGLYYECPASGCVVIAEGLTQQVANPVALFATDNNGIIIELPAVSTPQASVSGSLVFGIGTQSNNGLGGATVYTTDANGNFTTTYNNLPYKQSFLDSGSNGIYFLTSTLTGIPDCADAASFYCPSSTQNLLAVNQGANAASGKVTFAVANADSLFKSSPTATAFESLAGPNPQGFDWGLPFFYGRNVFTAIEGKTTPGGMGPYWAY